MESPDSDKNHVVFKEEPMDPIGPMDPTEPKEGSMEFQIVFKYKCIYCNEKIISADEISPEFGLKCHECIHIESYFKMLKQMPLIDINADDEDISDEVNNMLNNNKFLIIISYQKKNSSRLLHRICVSSEILDVEKFNKFGNIPKNSNVYTIVKKLYNFKKVSISSSSLSIDISENEEDDESSDI